MSQELKLVDHYDEMDQIVQGWLKYGADNTAMSNIARETGISRVKVRSYIEEWREALAANSNAQEQARDALQNYDTTIGMVQKELWAVSDNLKEKGDFRNQAGTLKSIADIEKGRQDTYAKAGIYADAEIGDQLAETEEKAKLISELLVKIARDYPESKTAIQEGLTEIFGVSPMVEMPVVTKL